MNTTFNTSIRPLTRSILNLDSQSLVKEMIMNFKRSALVLAVLLLATVLNRPASAYQIGEPVTDPANQHTYFLLTPNSTATTWTDADSAARVQGGHLVTINDASEAQWVMESFGANVLWTSTPGRTLGLPQPGKAIYGLVEIDFQSIRILASAYDPANQHLYKLLSSSSWSDANAKATALGGHLVTINDAAESQWVTTTFSGMVLWTSTAGRTLGGLPMAGKPVYGVVEVDFAPSASVSAGSTGPISTTPAGVGTLSMAAGMVRLGDDSNVAAAPAVTDGVTPTKHATWGQLKARFR